MYKKLSTVFRFNTCLILFTINMCLINESYFYLVLKLILDIKRAKNC